MTSRSEGTLGNFSRNVPLVLLFLLLFIACSSTDIPLPQSIGSMRLEKVQSGEEARREIDRLHEKQISFLQGYIGTYVAENGSGQLWVSEHSSEREATEVIEKMAHGMKQGKQQQFWHFRKILIEQRPVHLAVGMGQAHYFFQNGAKVIWLAVDPSLAKGAIRDAVRKIK
ncbi:MAG: hypothetical protein OES18_17115 [Deltaproteobacteria bacterium]|nr:hypothetical protein [Deltaproteobacteria bacterium]